MRLQSSSLSLAASIRLAGVILLLVLAEQQCRGGNAQVEDDLDRKDNDNHGVAMSSSYGFDVSFPIHRAVSTNYAWLPHNVDPENYPTTPLAYQDMPVQPLGNRHQIYLDMLHGCQRAYPENAHFCDHYEYHRMLMNQRQPSSMVNYTKTGFLKTKAPENVVQLVQDFWRNNHFKGKPEIWPVGNMYLNAWESPTYLVSVDDTGLRGSGVELKKQIWSAASATLEAWTDQELQPVSMYGIRVYSEGAIMLPHVDRLPLVVSAMICVAADLDEDWITEVYDHETGTAHNITLQPGEMLLFESHSVIHGHPFPLKGRSYAMIFIHFEPTGHSIGNDPNSAQDRIFQQYRQAVENGLGGPSNANADLPPYIRKSSPEEDNWRKEHPEGWQPPYPLLPPEAHAAAKDGKLAELRQQLENAQAKQELLEQRDEHGWQLLHQGVAGGNPEVVEFLVQQGASLNARTHGGYGETPLRIAEQRLGTQHPIATYLRSLGALSIGPEL